MFRLLCQSHYQTKLL